MRRFYIVSGILLIFPIIAVAAPVLVEDNLQGGVDVEDTRITMLGKRASELNELWQEFLSHRENFFPLSGSGKPPGPTPHPSTSSPPPRPADGWTDVKQSLPSIPELPEKPSPVSSPGREPPSPGSSTGSASVYESAEGDTLHKSSSAALSTMSDTHPEMVGAHGVPDPGPSTESDHLLTGVDAPLSSTVYPTWFDTNNLNGLPRMHTPQLNLGHSSPRPSTEFDSDHRLVVEEPASPTGLDAEHEYEVVHPLTGSDHEMAGVSPSNSRPSTNPERRSMGTGPRLEDFQAVNYALKGNGKE